MEPTSGKHKANELTIKVAAVFICIPFYGHAARHPLRRSIEAYRFLGLFRYFWNDLDGRCPGSNHSHTFVFEIDGSVVVRRMSDDALESFPVGDVGPFPGIQHTNVANENVDTIFKISAFTFIVRGSDEKAPDTVRFIPLCPLDFMSELDVFLEITMFFGELLIVFLNLGSRGIEARPVRFGRKGILISCGWDVTAAPWIAIGVPNSSTLWISCENLLTDYNLVLVESKYYLLSYTTKSMLSPNSFSFL